MMDFDPTKDYYDMDLSIETNAVKWNYWEFIKILVTLSSDSEIQKEIIGYGAVADEMAADFNTYCTLQSKKYVDFDLLTDDLVSRLNKIDSFFIEHYGDKKSVFWNDDFLDSHPDWKTIRVLAKDILRVMGFDDLKIDIERTVQKSQSSKGEPLAIETTKTRLIR
jgi:hypothetical protein